MLTISVVTTGHQFVVFKVDGIRTRLPGLYLYTGELASTFASEIQSGAPRNTNLLVVAASITEHKGTIGKGTYTASVGPFRLLGYPSDVAPRGTIKQFVKEHKGNRGITGGMPPTPRAAWWYLAKAGRDNLLTGRLSGRYGMAGARPRYWQALHEGKVPSFTGGVRPRNTFISDAHAAAFARYVARSSEIGRQM